MTTLIDDQFPLAEGIYVKIADDIHAIKLGHPNNFINQLTPVSAELVKWWFQDDYSIHREINFHAGQRDAILAIMYAHEILGITNLQELYEKVRPEALLTRTGLLSKLTEERNQHPKYAAKMATGTGKTWVLNALLIWQYLNHKASPHDSRFTNNFLIVAPGLIVYDRLLDSFLGKKDEQTGKRQAETSDIRLQSNLFVPTQHRQAVFSFIESSTVEKIDIGKKTTSGGVIAITNWHLLMGKEDPDFLDDANEDILAPGADIDAKAAAISLVPLSPGRYAGNDLEVLDRRFRRGEAMQWLKDLPSLMVFNDEAHHVHSAGGTEVEWQKSLLELSKDKGQNFVQVDFSATPYNEKRGKKEYFPHIIVDFDLLTAMNQGLVKSLVLDKRKEVATLSNDDLDFNAERDERNQIIGLSEGQRIMINAGLKKLEILEEQFLEHDSTKHPKLLIMTEDTKVSPYVVEHLYSLGYTEDEVLQVDSGRKAELGAKDWEPIKDKLFQIDKHKTPKIIVSVLMLREGFDVNNICVIVPLRSAKSTILAEQTVGRGLRLMWRGNKAIDEMKAENRELIRNHKEPSSYLDVLFVVEHPRFEDLYNELQGNELLGEVHEDRPNTTLGDLLRIDLREDYTEYDFKIPVILQDSEEELQTPRISIPDLPKCKFPIKMLHQQIGLGDVFSSHELQSGTQFGDYRVNGAKITAQGFNHYLSKLASNITGSVERSFTKEGNLKKNAGNPLLLQVHRATLIGWLNDYIRNYYFGETFNPLENEQWRILMLPDVSDDLIKNIFAALVDTLDEVVVSKAEIQYRYTSEIEYISVREGASVEVKKCIYPRLPYPTRSGGLEKLFMEWADKDAQVEALLKIQEYQYEFLRKPYLKTDGMPALYTPDFLIRTKDGIYIVEAKAQNQVSNPDVQRKMKAAVDWVKKINELDPADRSNRIWHYVLLGEERIRDWKEKGGTVVELLDHSRLLEHIEGSAELF